MNITVHCGCTVEYNPMSHWDLDAGVFTPDFIVTLACRNHQHGMDRVAVQWALQDCEKHAAHEKLKAEPWESPPPERVPWPTSARWWHRLRGHHTRSRYDFFSPPYAWQCLECNITMGHY